MTDLAAFLAARLDEDEAAATVALHRGARPHMAQHRPDRLLREVAAKRAILGAYEAVLKECAGMLGDRRPRKYGEHDGLLLAVEHLAAAYSDHPDYRPEWKP